jgi:hypothetical protein
MTEVLNMTEVLSHSEAPLKAQDDMNARVSEMLDQALANGILEQATATEANIKLPLPSCPARSVDILKVQVTQLLEGAVAKGGLNLEDAETLKDLILSHNYAASKKNEGANLLIPHLSDSQAKTLEAQSETKEAENMMRRMLVMGLESGELEKALTEDAQAQKQQQPASSEVPSGNELAKSANEMFNFAPSERVASSKLDSEQAPQAGSDEEKALQELERQADLA